MQEEQVPMLTKSFEGGLLSSLSPDAYWAGLGFCVRPQVRKQTPAWFPNADVWLDLPGPTPCRAIIWWGKLARQQPMCLRCRLSWGELVWWRRRGIFAFPPAFKRLLLHQHRSLRRTFQVQSLVLVVPLFSPLFQPKAKARSTSLAPSSPENTFRRSAGAKLWTMWANSLEAPRAIN